MMRAAAELGKDPSVPPSLRPSALILLAGAFHYKVSRPSSPSPVPLRKSWAFTTTRRAGPPHCPSSPAHPYNRIIV